MVKGAALFLQQGGSTQGPKTPTHHKHAGRINTEGSFPVVLAQIICTVEWKGKQRKFLWFFSFLFILNGVKNHWSDLQSDTSNTCSYF
uniref:Uncharacterized protein n=1 Tax=Salarias fasciatus TaxID=181472 RepID=A0A672FQN0_SALFA